MAKKIYFASPLFSEMEVAYNAKVVQQIRENYPEIEVYLPQEQGEINDKNNFADAVKIATYDTDALLTCDLVVAVLDGLVIDAGVASEIGVAYQAGIPVIGIFTDPRVIGADNPQKIAALREVGESQFPYVNLYTVGLIKKHGEIVTNTKELLQKIVQY